MTATVAGSLLGVMRAEVKGLSPAYFALVMATGIVSIAADLSGMRWIAVALFAFNIVAYAVLWAMTLLRIVWYTPLGRYTSDSANSIGVIACPRTIWWRCNTRVSRS